MLFYSKTTNGFYSDATHERVPVDAVEISEETYLALFAAQERGQVISGDARGYPFAADPAPAPGDRIKAQMAALEAQMTRRRVRECALGTDGGWMKRLDGQIEALRTQLAVLKQGGGA